MFLTALRGVLAHKARLLMTVLAVLLGVAFVSGTLVFTDTLGNAFRDSTAKSYREVAVAVSSWDTTRGNTRSRDQGTPSPGIDERTVSRLAAATGVASATGRVHGFAAVADQDGRLIGNGWSNTGANFAPGKDRRDPAYTFVDGSGPRSAGQIALDRTSAATGHYRVGDTVRVATNGPVREFTLSGVFTTEDGAVNAGGSLVLFDTRVAQQLFLKPGFFEDVTIGAAPGASERKVLSEVKSLLPENAEARTGKELAAEQAQEIGQQLSGLNQLLLAFAAVALFVGIFLISNTFTMLVAQRTKELALLRAVGASRRQVRRMVLTEAALVGVIASVAGFALGLLLAVGLRAAMGTFGAKMPAGPLVVTPGAVGAAFTVGVLITVFAAWLPARGAAKIPPVAAMNSAYAVPSSRSLVLRNTIGGVLVLLGVCVVLAGAAAGSGGRTLIGAGTGAALIGVIVLIPLLSRPVIALVQPLLRRVFGVSGTLAGRNAVRNPRRTGATASALAIGLTLITGISVLGVTLDTALAKLTTDDVKADFMVRMASGDGLDPAVLTALERTPEVSAVSGPSAADLKIKGRYHAASAVTPGDIERVLSVRAVSGSLDTLRHGGVAVAEKTARSNGWKTGDTLSVEFPDGGTGRLKVGAVYRENAFLSPLLISRDVAAAHDSDPYISDIWVTTRGGGGKDDEQALVDALGDSPAISVQDRQGIRDTNGGTISTALNILYGLLGMALLISVLGVVNTLAMSVFERRQEIGMLRAIGLDRRDVRRMVRLEAVVISVFGALVGVVLGTFLAWAVGETVKASIPGYELVVPWDRIALFLLVAGLVGVGAALWPARSAARLNLLSAIRSE